MRTPRAPSLKGILASLSTVVVLAGATVAGARGVLFISSVDEDPVQVEEPLEDGVECPVDDPEADEQLPEECEDDGLGDQDGGDPDEGDEVEEDPGDGDNEGERRLASPEREAACIAAAGVEDQPLPEGRRTGLDNAVGRVLENCLKNPDAPGLLNALERLSENRARKAARDEAKAERRQEREAKQAARRAEREERKAAKDGGGAPSRSGSGVGKGSGGPPPHAGGPPPSLGGGNGKAKGKP